MSLLPRRSWVVAGFLAALLLVVIAALAWGPFFVTSPDEALVRARSERVPGYKDLDYGGLVSRYEAVVGKQGLWRTKQNRGLRESLFQGDEDGWTWIVTWTAPEGDQLWFAIGPIGGLVTREPDLVVRLLGTVLGPDGVRRFYEAIRR